MDLNNFGATSLNVRVAFRNGTSGRVGSWYVSQSFSLQPNSGWPPASFPIGPTDVTFFSGDGSSDYYSQVLANVNSLCILHNNNPQAIGGTIDGNLGVDNITASAIPEPPAAVVWFLALASAAFCGRARSKKFRRGS